MILRKTACNIYRDMTLIWVQILSLPLPGWTYTTFSSCKIIKKNNFIIKNSNTKLFKNLNMLLYVRMQQIWVLLLIPIIKGSFTTVIDFVPQSFDFLEPTSDDYTKLYNFKFLHWNLSYLRKITGEHGRLQFSQLVRE